MPQTNQSNYELLNDVNTSAKFLASLFGTLTSIIGLALDTITIYPNEIYFLSKFLPRSEDSPIEHDVIENIPPQYRTQEEQKRLDKYFSHKRMLTWDGERFIRCQPTRPIRRFNFELEWEKNSLPLFTTITFYMGALIGALIGGMIGFSINVLRNVFSHTPAPMFFQPNHQCIESLSSPPVRVNENNKASHLSLASNFY